MRRRRSVYSVTRCNQVGAADRQDRRNGPADERPHLAPVGTVEQGLDVLLAMICGLGATHLGQEVRYPWSSRTSRTSRVLISARDRPRSSAMAGLAYCVCPWASSSHRPSGLLSTARRIRGRAQRPFLIIMRPGSPSLCNEREPARSPNKPNRTRSLAQGVAGRWAWEGPRNPYPSIPVPPAFRRAEIRGCARGVTLNAGEPGARDGRSRSGRLRVAGSSPPRSSARGGRHRRDRRQRRAARDRRALDASFAGCSGR